VEAHEPGELMTITLSRAVRASSQAESADFSTRTPDLQALGGTPPIVMLDDFRAAASPFAPHPHAGFSAVTYVFPDSPSGLRSRTSKGDDLVVGPGGVVWTEAGRGIIHEERPSERGRVLHGAQIFVNLHARNKLAEPHVYGLRSDAIPQWTASRRDRVRVISGEFAGVRSTLSLLEPFSFLDVELQTRIALDLPDGHNALFYALEGTAEIRAGEVTRRISSNEVLVARSSGGSLSLEAIHHAKVLVLSGSDPRERMVVRGPFIMNDESQLADSIAAYETGEMGHLSPLPAE
jgi:redox-sensitive bicupin YhaK (pirin superfamily)